jgi:hypothetical protein
MRRLSLVLAIFLTLCLISIPLIVKSQGANRAKTNSNTYEVLLSSPSTFEVNNGTILYSGAINTATPQNKVLAAEHSKIAVATIEDIEKFRYKLYQTRKINKEYMDNLGLQLELWKKLADSNPDYKNILSRELEVYNLGVGLQLEENVKWSVIDGTLSEIDKLNEDARKKANESIDRSALYTRLIIYYVDLIDFYKNKYKEIITVSTLNHAIQENPNLNLPPVILNQIKPYHEKELQAAKGLLYDLDDNFSKLKEISDQAQQLDEFYLKLDKYSLAEVTKIIGNLQQQADNIRANQHDFLASGDVLQAIDGYIDYYKTLQGSLEDQILAREIKEATILAMYDRELTKIAYTGMLHPGVHYVGLGAWVSSAWEGVKTGTKIVVGGAYATADYVTGKAADTIFEISDKASAAYDHGLFSDEYKNFANAYDKAGEQIYTVSIKDTFVDPLANTLAGNDKQGLGQAAVNKAQQSFQDTDKYLADATGSQFLSQVALNTITVGGYGLAKDCTTLSDANASTADKVVAGAGVLLALVPAVSGAKSANKAVKDGTKSLVKNVSGAADDIGLAVANSNAASSTLKNATTNMVNATDDMIRAAGPNFKNADVLDDVFDAAARNFDNAVVNKVTAQQAYNQAQQQVSSAIKTNLVNVPKNTLIDGAASGARGFVEDHTLAAIKGRLADLYSNSLEQAIKNAEPIFGDAVEDAIGHHIANFTASNFVNNMVTGGITKTLDTIIKYDPNNPPNSGSNSQGPINNQPPGGIQNQPLVQPPVSSGMQNQSLVPPLSPGQNTGFQNPYLPNDPGAMQSQPATNSYGLPPGYTPPQQQYPPYPQTGYTQPGQQPGSYPPGMNQPTTYIDPSVLQQLFGNNQNRPNIDPNIFDQTIGQIQNNQTAWNDNRGANTVPNNPNISMNPDMFNTDPNAGPGNSGQSTIDRVQNLSTQTGQMRPPQQPQTPHQPQQPQQPSNNSSTPPSNIPIGDGVAEQDRTNGLDDDNDGVIDEGPSNGSCQIAIHDTGGDKDDQWELKVDGSSIGRNNQGKTRYWDLNLPGGQHTVSATGVDVPDNVGTYTIWFGTCSKVDGPSLSGSNLNQGKTFTWTIRVP